MEGLADVLNKLSVDDVQKLKVIFAAGGSDATYSNSVSLRVFCDEYEEYIKSNRTENYYNSVAVALKHLTDHFGLQKPISNISFKDMELFVTNLRKHVPKGYRVYYRTLKAAFNKAVDWNYIKENHLKRITLPKENKLNPSFICEYELEKIVEKIENDVVKDVVKFAFYTGMRLSEIVNLKWKNVDLAKRIIVVGDAEFTTKGKNQRYVPICEEVGIVLKKRQSFQPSAISNQPSKLTEDKLLAFSIEQKKNAYVFCKENGFKYTGNFFSRRFKKACKIAGIDPSIHFHSLRHSFASNLAQKGVSLYVIKELLGHSSISTTEIYSHLNMESLRDAVDLLNKSSYQSTVYSEQQETKRKPQRHKDAERSKNLKLVVSQARTGTYQATPKQVEEIK